MILTFESVDKILTCDIKMETIEQYFPGVLFTNERNIFWIFFSVLLLKVVGFIE